MAETALGINITTNGATEAAAGLSQVTQQFGTLGAGHDALKNKFQERFQHIGLMLFVGDALRAAGVGAEARAVVSTLSLAINTLATSFGLATGPVFLITTALTALVGIVAKISEHNDKHSESLVKLIKSESDELKSTDDLTQKLIKYENEIGGLPPVLERVLEAKLKLANFIRDEEIKSLELSNKQLEQEIKHQQETQGQLENGVIPAVKEWFSVQKDVVSALIHGQSVTDGLNEHNKKLAESFDKNRESMVRNKAQIDENKATIDALQKGYVSLADEIDNQSKEAKDDLDREAEASRKLADQQMAQMEEGVKQAEKEYEAKQKIWQNFGEQAGHVIKSIDQEQANAFAKMVVEGKSFGDEMAHLWQHIAEQVVAKIEMMIAEWMIWQAITGGVGGPASNFGGFTGGIGKALGFATGGSMVVDRPTLMLAGDSGPELASFTPLSQMSQGMGPAGSSGGGVTINIGSVQSTAYGVEDPDQLADTVGRKIIERVRGMGELNFTRSS